MRSRVTALILVIVGLLFGTGMGFFVFQKGIHADTRYKTISTVVKSLSPDNPPVVKYSGTVLRHDEENKVLVLNVPSSFSTNASNTLPVMVSYTPETTWMSIEYAFRDGVMEKRLWKDEEPRQLPRDALVSVVQYYDGTKWRTIAIAFLRKTNL